MLLHICMQLGPQFMLFNKYTMITKEDVNEPKGEK